MEQEEYSENTRALQPKHINSRHRALMRRLIAGQELQDAAKELGYTVSRASLVANSPLFKEEMEKMRTEVDQQFVEDESSKVHIDQIRVRLKEEALKSLDTLVGLRDVATSERVRQLSAIEILDRAGYKASEKIEGELVIDASDGLVEAIGQAMKEMRAKEGTGEKKE